MQRVILAHDPFDHLTWTEHQVEDVRAFLVETFEVWPKNARLYHGTVAVSNDVTPQDEADVEALASMDGPFVVVVYPADPLTIIIAIVAVVVLAAALYFLMPKIPAVATQRNQQASSNNSLADRGNQPRVGSRINDIYGKLKCYPDLIALPYRKFLNNIEVEVALLCIGRGDYEVSDIKDDTTPYGQIASASLEVYAPYTSPSSGDDPVILIGNPIIEPLITAKRFTTVDGQVLKATEGASTFTVDCQFTAPNSIVARPQIEVGNLDPHDIDGGPQFIDVDLTQYFNTGDHINVATEQFTSGATTVKLGGVYQVASVTPLEITLVSPATVNADWTVLAGLPGGQTSFLNTGMSATGEHWIGPFTINVPNQTEVYCNVVALSGLYKDDGTNQYATSVDLVIELTPSDNDGNPTGGPTETFNATIVGSPTEKDQVGLTIECVPTFDGPCNIRMKRSSPTDTGFKGTVVDEIKWRDVYGVAPVTQTDFGNVTIVYARTVATTSALAVKDRKLNMLVTRKVPQRIGTTSTFGALAPSTSADDILCAIALDPHIGNRNVDELDVANIYDTIALVKYYFGIDDAGQFSYTFDDNNLSFEETFAIICSAVFCQGFRRGNLIKLFFEKSTNNSTLLFNHRNKVPDSETRTVRFGILEDTDGIEYNYVSPTDDAPLTYYIPTDRSAVNPKKIDGTGVRSAKQAFLQAWRAWNKIQYQIVTTEFEALKEAELVVLGQRILVADNTRDGIQDGEVIGQSVLTLTLSQPVELSGGESIFLQLSTGVTQSIPITAGPEANQVILTAPPTVPLVVDDNAYIRTPYQIVTGAEPRGNAFLLADRSVASNETRTLTAINYDERYYEKDATYFSHFDSTDMTFDDSITTWDHS